jgi:hypothetical protein
MAEGSKARLGASLGVRSERIYPGEMHLNLSIISGNPLKSSKCDRPG